MNFYYLTASERYPIWKKYCIKGWSHIKEDIYVMTGYYMRVPISQWTHINVLRQVFAHFDKGQTHGVSANVIKSLGYDQITGSLSRIPELLMSICGVNDILIKHFRTCQVDIEQLFLLGGKIKWKPLYKLLLLLSVSVYMKRFRFGVAVRAIWTCHSLMRFSANAL